MIDFVLSIIFTFYFLKDKEMLFKTIRRFGRAFIPGKLGTVLKQFIIDLDEVVGGFVRGVLLDALIVGIVSSILMLMIHHPFAVLVGVIAGICNVGGSVGLPAVWTLIALTIGGGYAGAIGMIVAVPTAAILSVYVHRIYKKKLII